MRRDAEISSNGMLERIARSIAGAVIHHYIDFNDDVNAINEACEKNGCTVKYKFTKYSMEATISNGCVIEAEEFNDVFSNEEAFVEYNVIKNGRGLWSEGCTDVNVAIEAVFEDGKDS